MQHVSTVKMKSITHARQQVNRISGPEHRWDLGLEVHAAEGHKKLQNALEPHTAFLPT